jgi:hypothetical protein
VCVCVCVCVTLINTRNQVLDLETMEFTGYGPAMLSGRAGAKEHDFFIYFLIGKKYIYIFFKEQPLLDRNG